MGFQCVACGRPYPEEGVPYRCECGGVFGAPQGLFFDSARFAPGLPGIWAYRYSFNLPMSAPIISLGEGSTPLVETTFFSRQVFFKLEYTNPTGSYKDRLVAPIISLLISQVVTEAVEDSSGNAGAAFAAYAARGGLQARVFVPESAAGPKLEQIRRYGAEVEVVDGPRVNASEAALRVVKNGSVYASHAYLPHGLAGIATMAYEITSALGQQPGAVIAPVGHGGLLLGLTLGFNALKASGLTDSVPVLVGVQAENCAPFLSPNRPAKISPTAADGISVASPVRAEELYALQAQQDIRFVSVPESRILSGRDHLAGKGFYVEATSAVVLDAFRQLVDVLPDPVVLILTGSGLKQA
jgi:threonine synthase